MDGSTFRNLPRSRSVTCPQALAIGLLFSLALLPAPSGAVEPSTDHDVVIVGAGASGLYAAYTLDNLGYSVLILEATNRHGGRVYSDTLGDVGIEHGAEELYGAMNNFVFNDIQAAYGVGAQTKIFEGSPTQDTMIVMDADGMGGGSTCWSETGSCGSDADIVDYWDFYYDIGNHSNDPTDGLVSEYLDTTWGVPSTSRGYHLYEVAFPVPNTERPWSAWGSARCRESGTAGRSQTTCSGWAQRDISTH